jgi:hypothetical protein
MRRWDARGGMLAPFRPLGRCYYTPGGTRLASKSLAFAASSKLTETGSAQGEAEIIAQKHLVELTPDNTEAEANARRQAAMEGLTLVASRRSGTGYKCVVYNTAYRKRPYNVQVKE